MFIKVHVISREINVNKSFSLACVCAILHLVLDILSVSSLWLKTKTGFLVQYETMSTAKWSPVEIKWAWTRVSWGTLWLSQTVSWALESPWRDTNRNKSLVFVSLTTNEQIHHGHSVTEIRIWLWLASFTVLMKGFSSLSWEDNKHKVMLLDYEMKNCYSSPSPFIS